MSKLEIEQQSQIFGSMEVTVMLLGCFFRPVVSGINYHPKNRPSQKENCLPTSIFYSGKLLVFESVNGLGLVVWCFGRIFPNTFRLSLIQAQPGCSQVQSFGGGLEDQSTSPWVGCFDRKLYCLLPTLPETHSKRP